MSTYRVNDDISGKLLSDGTTGTLGTGGVLFKERRQFYLDPYNYAELFPSITPFYTNLIDKAQRRTDLQDPHFKMFEHTNPWVKQQVTINSAVTVAKAGTESNAIALTSIVGLNSAVSAAYEGLQLEIWDSTLTTKRGQAVITTAYPHGSLSAGEVKMKSLMRNTSDDADFTTVAGDIAFVIGNAQGDGSSAPDAWSDELSVVWNNTQEFRTAVLVKGALLQASLRGANDELGRLRIQKAQEQAIQINKALLRSRSRAGTGMSANDVFGDGSVIKDGAGNVIRTTNGLVSTLEMYGVTDETSDVQNIFDRSQGYVYNKFIDDMLKLTYVMPTGGIFDAVCGPAAMGYWSKMESSGQLKSQFQADISNLQTDRLGYNFKYLDTPYASIRLVLEPALRDAMYSNYMVIVDYENLIHAFFEAPSYHTNILTDNNPKLVKDEYMNHEGVGIRMLPKHKIFKLPVA